MVTTSLAIIFLGASIITSVLAVHYYHLSKSAWKLYKKVMQNFMEQENINTKLIEINKKVIKISEELIKDLKDCTREENKSVIEEKDE
jgi:hypothetical protein